MADILVELLDLEKQATTERSHNYVAQCCRLAIAEIERLRLRIAALEPISTLERCARIAETVAQETGDSEGELYIARKIADRIRTAAHL
jgi:hypothetical protein